MLHGVAAQIFKYPYNRPHKKMMRRNQNRMHDRPSGNFRPSGRHATTQGFRDLGQPAVWALGPLLPVLAFPHSRQASPATPHHLHHPQFTLPSTMKSLTCLSSVAATLPIEQPSSTPSATAFDPQSGHVFTVIETLSPNGGALLDVFAVKGYRDDDIHKVSKIDIPIPRPFLELTTNHS